MTAVDCGSWSQATRPRLHGSTRPAFCLVAQYVTAHGKYVISMSQIRHCALWPEKLGVRRGGVVAKAVLIHGVSRRDMRRFL